ncbi:hypothetical protein HBI09_089710 [Parastagonospora nodorum]|nr:hypothetical protein HBI09_089710 [Parastagonospora nodorum]
MTSKKAKNCARIKAKAAKTALLKPREDFKSIESILIYLVSKINKPKCAYCKKKNSKFLAYISISDKAKEAYSNYYLIESKRCSLINTLSNSPSTLSKSYKRSALEFFINSIYAIKKTKKDITKAI